jgi:uncharacterized protein YdhG (YjbR/CyaY superfamily)
MEKQKEQYTTIDQYIILFPENVQKILEKIRSVIKKITPEAQESICYGIPTFKLKENLVHFAAYKQHIGFYPTPLGIANFQKELA